MSSTPRESRLPRRVTMKDIAQAAGVSVSTVSLAMSGSPKIPDATREHIREIAQSLGYRPDPVMSALAAYRSKLRVPKASSVLAYITNHASCHEWKENPTFLGFFKGASARGIELGYKVEEFWLRGSTRSQAHASRVLLNRGISGLLIAPLPESMQTGHLSLKWDLFASVLVGTTLQAPLLNHVANDQFQDVRTLCRQLRHLGYQRIGFALSQRMNWRLRGRWLAAYLYEQTIYMPPSAHLPAYLPPLQAEDTFMSWVREWKPDAIIAQEAVVGKWLKKHGLRVPEDIGLAHPDVPGDRAEFTGINIEPERIGGMAVDLLHTMLLRGDRGVPDSPIAVLRRGLWQSGSEVRKQTTIEPKSASAGRTRTRKAPQKK